MEKEIKAKQSLPAVKVMYRSPSGRNINKKLFGYGPWNEVKSGKVYQHKPVPGLLQGKFVQKCGRACLVVPQEMVGPVKTQIVRLGGEIKSTTPMILTKKEIQETADRNYAYCLKILGGLFENASTSRDKQDFISNIKRASIITRRFEAYIKEAAKYAEEKPESIELETLFKGLQSIYDEDFEAGKIQAEFLAKSLEREYTEIMRAQEK